MECRSVPRWPAILALFWLALAAGAPFLILSENSTQRVAGWVGLGLLVPLLLVVVRAMREPGSVALRIDERGVEYVPFGTGVIPWREIRALHRTRAGTVHFLSLDLGDETRHRACASEGGRKRVQANEQLGLPPFSIGFGRLLPNLEEVWEHLEAHHPSRVRT